jgi:hypothetical protein
MRYILLVLIFVLASSVGNETSSAQVTPENIMCKRDYAQYRRRPTHKAFAVTVGKYKRHACGMGWSYKTRGSAVRRALRECGIGAVRQGIPAKACRILASQ